MPTSPTDHPLAAAGSAPSERGLLAGRVAVVTGAARGIGKAIAERFVAEGARVVVADRDAAGAEVAAHLAEGRTDSAVFHPADVTDSRSVATLIAATLARWGRLDVLVNNAGAWSLAPVGDLDEAEWDRLIAVNLTSVYLTCKHALPALLRRGRGSIVNIASAGGVLPRREGGAYCTAKAGVIMLTKCIALDYGGLGIRANVISPARVDTEGMREFMGLRPGERAPPSVDAAGTERRPAAPEEIASVALFLASDQSSYVNGANVVVDAAGYTLGAFGH